MDSSDERLQEGIAAYKRGHKGEAYRLVKQAVRLNPKNEMAWLWLSGFVETDEQRRECFRRALAINPTNQIALKRLAKLSAEPVEEKRPSTPPESLPPAVPSPQPISTKPAIDPKFDIQPSAVDEKKRDGRLKILLAFGLVVAIIALAFSLFSPVISPIVLDYFGFTTSAPTTSQAFSSEEESAVLSPVYENIAASNVENIERYMASIHTQSANYQTTRELIEALYRDYDLTATLSRVELVSYSSEEAQVRFVLETRKRNGPEFRDNIINGTFILRPENGQWKLFDQVVNNIEYVE